MRPHPGAVAADPRLDVATPSRRPSRAKRGLRALWRRLPRTGATYAAGKAVTRTVLRPERTSLVAAIRLPSGVELRVDLADAVGNDLYCLDDHYEARTLALWRRLARDAATIADLGAHVGLFACVAAAANPRARVVAVEGFAPNVALLRDNAAAFANVVAVEAFVGATAGRGVFRPSAARGGGALAESGDGVVVDTITLADVAARWLPAGVGLVKIDLEGLEHALLGGEEAFWDRWSPAHVVVEVAGRATAPLFAAMARRGYRCRRIESLYTLRWLRREALANWHFWKDG